MSDITPTNQNALAPLAQRPSYLQNVESKVDALAVGGGGLPRVSLNNNVISLVVDGEVTHVFGQQAQACILGTMPGVGRVFYADQYNPGSANIPTCWSEDGQTAADSVQNCPSPNRTCAGCPMNIKGSAANGQGKACQYVKALAVLFPQDPQPGRVYRLLAKGGTIFGDDRPDQQMFNLKNLAAFMKTHNLPLGPLVFNMVIDVYSQTPSKLLFQPAGWVDEQFYHDVIEKIPEAEIEQVVSLDFGSFADAAEQPVQPAAPQPAPQPVQQVAPQPVQQPAPQPAAQPVQQAVPQPEPAPQQATQQAPQPAAQDQTAETSDVGAVSPEALAEALSKFQAKL